MHSEYTGKHKGHKVVKGYAICSVHTERLVGVALPWLFSPAQRACMHGRHFFHRTDDVRTRIAAHRPLAQTFGRCRFAVMTEQRGFRKPLDRCALAL